MTVLKKLREGFKQALHEHSAFGKLAEVADHRRHERNAEFEKARASEERAREEFNDVLQHEHTDRELADARDILGLCEMRTKSLRKKREFWRNKYVWANERHHHWGDVLKHRRDRVRRWIMQHEQFQPYMANGKPYEKLTDTCKHAIFLDFKEGLYVTSTYEGFSGDGVHATSSYHYLTNQPDGLGRCWDAGSSRRGPMVKCQQRQAQEFAAFLVESFGPENSLAYKNGVRFTLVEGTELETMHDNHVHTDIRDGAFA
jgi:hypothetical protein